MESQQQVKANLQMILTENQKLSEKLDFQQIAFLIEKISASERIFVHAAGRSGLAMRMAAMRLMHLGINVFIAGDTLTPAIDEGDLLIAASGSGTTSSIVTSVEKAKKQKAAVVVLTADVKSKLSQLADSVVYLPAATKTDFGSSASEQYAGSLFEQALLFVLEAVFMTLWKNSGLTKEDLWRNHANLE